MYLTHHSRDTQTAQQLKNMMKLSVPARQLNIAGAASQQAKGKNGLANADCWDAVPITVPTILEAMPKGVEEKSSLAWFQILVLKR